MSPSPETIEIVFAPHVLAAIALIGLALVILAIAIAIPSEGKNCRR